MIDSGVNRLAEMPDRSAVLEDIRALMQASPSDRARIERTLTDGYAHALELEVERLQLERRIGEVTARIGAEPEAGLLDELAELSRELTRIDTSLSELRTLLASLRDRARRGERV